MFFGTSEFAVPILHLAARKTDLAGVVTQPDRPAGRGHKLRPTPVKVAAQRYEVPIFEPASLGSFARERAGENYDLFVVVSYGRILPQALLDLPLHGALNVHPSLLPQYRGSTPIQNALRDGQRRTGVSLILMDAGMDTGQIVLQEATQIGDDENYQSLHDRLAGMGARMLGEAIDLLARAELPHAPQTGAVCVTRPIAKDDLSIDWSWSAERIVNLVRAFSPQPSARAMLEGIPLKLLRATRSPNSAPSAKPGEMVGVKDDAVLVQTGAGELAIHELIAPNRGRMSGAAFAVPILASRS